MISVADEKIAEGKKFEEIGVFFSLTNYEKMDYLNFSFEIVFLFYPMMKN